jgi:hypothetical protein
MSEDSSFIDFTHSQALTTNRDIEMDNSVVIELAISSAATFVDTDPSGMRETLISLRVVLQLLPTAQKHADRAAYLIVEKTLDVSCSIFFIGVMYFFKQIQYP